ncbi:FkbM family methyltransferase [Nonlabens sp.]|uniref:FkbM family methyltransferase n=1 Tax=Nonlabens sp. TaxID=1888209 RepID=UPI001BCEA780|nr:FkbM family methyltransferase [Nonlabens sp.]
MAYKIIKKLIQFLVPGKVKLFIAQEKINDFQRKYEMTSLSFSQEGEDLILERFLEKKEKGFYVDIGAHDPKRFSNTALFYAKGWNGLNVDPLPGVMDKFKILRPNDINLEIGVSLVEQELDYFMFNEPALNTFSKEEAQIKEGQGVYKIIQERKIKTYPLNAILDTCIKPGTQIDFMTIDVEGLDLDVLKSNDWERFRPRLLLVENLKKQSIERFIDDSEMFKFLKGQDYSFIAKTLNTLFFKDNIS